MMMGEKDKEEKEQQPRNRSPAVVVGSYSNTEKEVDNDVCSRFDDIGLKMNVLRGIYGMGFEIPSVIQQRAIIPVYKGHDCICQAQSGTGKTAAFCTGILQRVDLSLKEAQAIVLAPTRELARQICDVISNIAMHLKGIKIHLLIGGIGQPSNRTHAMILDEGVHIVVGTPGRVLQMVADIGALRVGKLKMLVLDEADEMLSMGFKDQIYELVKFLPEEMQVCLFSATMPQEALDLTTTFMRNPVKILVKKEEVTLLGIEQYFIDVQREEF